METKVGTLTIQNGEVVIENETTIDFNEVEKYSNDPMAYYFGHRDCILHFKNQANKPLPALRSKARRELAPEYIRGYEETMSGEIYKKGEKQNDNQN